MLKQAALILNPAAGHAPLLTARLPAIESVLSDRGYALHLAHTTPSADSARDLALSFAKTASVVFACGGDGTVHGVIQGLVHTGVALGILPLGTANALARNLGIPLDPLAALTTQLAWSPRTIPLGEITTARATSLFAVMAGSGPDGALVHALSAGSRLKHRFGRTAYYAHAVRLALTRRFPAFQVDFRRPDATAWESLSAVAMLAARIPDLGGLFSGLTRRASLTGPHLHVQLLRPPAQLALPAWILCARTGLPNPWLTTLDVAELRCTPIGPHPVYAQADAEPLGPLPISLRAIPNALTLLMPLNWR